MFLFLFNILFLQFLLPYFVLVSLLVTIRSQQHFSNITLTLVRTINENKVFLNNAFLVFRKVKETNTVDFLFRYRYNLFPIQTIRTRVNYKFTTKQSFISFRQIYIRSPILGVAHQAGHAGEGLTYAHAPVLVQEQRVGLDGQVVLQADFSPDQSLQRVFCLRQSVLQFLDGVLDLSHLAHESEEMNTKGLFRFLFRNISN